MVTQPGGDEGGEDAEGEGSHRFAPAQNRPMSTPTLQDIQIQKIAQPRLTVVSLESAGGVSLALWTGRLHSPGRSWSGRRGPRRRRSG